MKVNIGKERFGPWALITGASSGIGREFARQIAAAGINVVLVARRETTLIEVGRSIAKDFKVQHRVIAMDLSQEGFIPKLAELTKDLDIGLVVSNAGTGNSGAQKSFRCCAQDVCRKRSIGHAGLSSLSRPSPTCCRHIAL